MLGDTICTDLTSRFNCPFLKKSRDCFSYAEYLGVRGINMGASINTFPNPVTDQLLVNNMRIGCLVELYDITGRRMLHVQQANNTLRLSLNVSNLATATYILKITDENGRRETRKIVKQ